MKEPCEHVEHLPDLKRIARDHCGIRPVRNNLAALCAQMRDAKAEIDEKGTCSILPDCAAKYYDLATLKGIAKYCEVDVRGKKRLDACHALQDAALSGKTRMQMRTMEGKLVDTPQGLEDMGRRIKAVRALKVPKPNKLHDAETTALVPADNLTEFLRSNCAHTVFSKRELAKLFKTLASTPLDHRVAELAKWLLEKRRTVKEDGRKDTEVLRAITFLYLHDAWPKEAFDKELNASVDQIARFFVHEQLPRILRKNPNEAKELRKLSTPDDVREALRGDHEVRTYLRTIFAEWCLRGGAAVPSLGSRTDEEQFEVVHNDFTKFITGYNDELRELQRKGKPIEGAVRSSIKKFMRMTDTFMIKDIPAACRKLGVATGDKEILNTRMRKYAPLLHPDKHWAFRGNAEVKERLNRMSDLLQECTTRQHAQNKVNWDELRACDRTKKGQKLSDECHEVVEDAKKTLQNIVESENLANCHLDLGCPVVPPPIDKARGDILKKSNACLKTRVTMSQSLRMPQLSEAATQCLESGVEYFDHFGTKKERVAYSDAVAERILPFATLNEYCGGALDAKFVSAVLWLYRLVLPLKYQDKTIGWLERYIPHAIQKDKIGKAIKESAGLNLQELMQSTDLTPEIQVGIGEALENDPRSRPADVWTTKGSCFQVGVFKDFTFLALDFPPETVCKFLHRTVGRADTAHMRTGDKEAAYRSYSSVSETCLAIHYLSVPTDIAVILAIPLLMYISLYESDLRPAHVQHVEQFHDEKVPVGPFEDEKGLREHYEENIEKRVDSLATHIATNQPFVVKERQQQWQREFTTYAMTTLLNHGTKTDVAYGMITLEHELKQLFGRYVGHGLINSYTINLQDNEQVEVISPSNYWLELAMDYAVTSEKLIQELWKSTVPGIPENSDSWLAQVLHYIVHEISTRFLKCIHSSMLRHRDEYPKEDVEKWADECEEVFLTLDRRRVPWLFQEMYAPNAQIIDAYPRGEVNRLLKDATVNPYFKNRLNKSKLGASTDHALGDSGTSDDPHSRFRALWPPSSPDNLEAPHESQDRSQEYQHSPSHHSSRSRSPSPHDEGVVLNQDAQADKLRELMAPHSPRSRSPRSRSPRSRSPRSRSQRSRSPRSRSSRSRSSRSRSPSPHGQGVALNQDAQADNLRELMAPHSSRSRSSA